MNTVQDIRRNNLRALVKMRANGNMAALSRVLGKSPPLLNDCLRSPPRKAIGEKLARSIEEKLELPVGWLDIGDQTVVPPDLSSAEELFLLSVRAIVRERGVPAHVMQTILLLLEAAPVKATALQE